MSVTSEEKTIHEEGENKPAFVVSFTNGAKQQIEDLQAYFKAPDLLEVVKLGITVLERIKEKGSETSDKKDDPKPGPSNN